MKLWLPILLLVAANAFSQRDTGNNALNIPPIKPPETTAPVMTPPKKDPYYVPPSIKGEPSKSYSLDLDNKINFGAPKPKFENPGDAIAERINTEGSGGKNFKELRVNKHVGEFRVKSSLITIHYQDTGALIDGEHISVYINDRLVRDLVMTGNRESIDIPLDKGFNKIALKVTNVGTVWPSTITYEVTDDKGKLLTSDTWAADTGIISDMVIFNE